MNSDDFRPDPEDYRIDTGAVRCLKPAHPAVRGGAIGCYNSAAADNHAHEEGILAGREMYLEALREEVESRLNDGDSICLGAYSYNKREILSEGLGAEGELLLAELHTLGTEAAAKALREHLETVLAKWIKDNIDDIAMVEYGVAA